MVNEEKLKPFLRHFLAMDKSKVTPSQTRQSIPHGMQSDVNSQFKTQISTYKKKQPLALETDYMDSSASHVQQ